MTRCCIQSHSIKTYDPCQDVLHLLETESPALRSAAGSPINDISKSTMTWCCIQII
jgi:hypothetical protein